MKKIMIVDDHAGTVDNWIEKLSSVPKIKDEFDVVPVKAEEFKTNLKLLETRRKDARSIDVDVAPEAYDDIEKCSFDDAYILIVDYDLLDFDVPDEGAINDHLAGVSTGTRVAYLARCYSTCGLIVVLNKYGINKFNLKLKEDFDSYADIDLGSDQLDNDNLWTGGLPTGFRPWSWFSLLEAAKSFESRWKELIAVPEDGDESVLKSPLLRYLGFPNNFTDYFPRSLIEFLGSSAELSELTFREFAMNTGRGLLRKDKALNDEALARIAAARIFKWLENVILPGQDILVDAPHLVSRFPSLLVGEDKQEISVWNHTALQNDDESVSIDRDFLNRYSFKKDWTARPTWFWHALRNNEGIEEVKDPFASYAKEIPDFVFCEDISAFLPKRATREFVAELTSPFVRRFVVDPDTDEGKQYAESIRNVDYDPRYRFAL